MTRRQYDRATTISCLAFLISLAAWTITRSYWLLGASALAGIAVLWFAAAAEQAN